VAPDLRSVTDHVLAGPTVDEDVDRDGLYHSLMGDTGELERRHTELVSRMRDAGVTDPHTAITEMQLTVSTTDGADRVLSPPWLGSRHHDSAAELPGKKSIAEAVWDAIVVHDAVRSEGAIELITHTGLVNHGGGLQKRRERVWADPCHYGHAMGSALFEKTPVGVDVACDTVSTDGSAGGGGTAVEFPVLDALAAVDDDECAVVVVHRASGVGDVETLLDLGTLTTGGEATVTTLTGESMSSENSLDDPENVSPEREGVPLEDGEVRLTIPEYGLVSVVAPR
jgi:alpha-N-arabinofuranosidase